MIQDVERIIFLLSVIGGMLAGVMFWLRKKGHLLDEIFQMDDEHGEGAGSVSFLKGLSSLVFLMFAAIIGGIAGELVGFVIAECLRFGGLSTCVEALTAIALLVGTIVMHRRHYQMD